MISQPTPGLIPESSSRNKEQEEFDPGVFFSAQTQGESEQVTLGSMPLCLYIQPKHEGIMFQGRVGSPSLLPELNLDRTGL